MSALPPFVPPSGLTKLLVADPVSATSGPIEATASPTMVGDVPVAALVEEQSTTKAHLFPRMTTAQMNAISPAVDGMAAYDTTLSSLRFLQGGNWNVNFSQVTVSISNAALITLHDAPFLIIPPPGAGFITLIDRAYFTLITGNGHGLANGGNTFLQYGNAPPLNLDSAASRDVDSGEMTGATTSRIYGMNGALFTFPAGIRLTHENQGVYLTNLDDNFTGDPVIRLLVRASYTKVNPIV